MFILLSILALISGVMAIRADYTSNHQQHYIFKPLTMVFIIAIALLEESTISSTYKTLIIAGLLFSIMGDVWIMLPQDYFVRGLISFLIAHLFYIVAFSLPNDHLAPLPYIVVFALFGAGVFAYLRPSLGEFLIPVAVYMVVILLMGWQAFNRGQEVDGGLAIIGALLFMTSDTLLAINKFRQPFRAAQLLILATYFAAQWFIAQSI